MYSSFERDKKNKDFKNTIDLFLIEKDGKSHYTLIKNFHRLIRSQKTGSNKKNYLFVRDVFGILVKKNY